MSTAVMVAVAEWVVAGEVVWVADVGTSERVAVRAVARLVARMVVEGRTVARAVAARAASARAAVARATARAVVMAAVVLAVGVERAGAAGAVGQGRASVATSDRSHERAGILRAASSQADALLQTLCTSVCLVRPRTAVA